MTTYGLVAGDGEARIGGWAVVSLVTARLATAVVLLLLAAPFATAAAQSPGTVPRVGFLGPNTRSPNPRTLNAFLQGLRELGWVEGTNLVIEYRWAEGRSDRLPGLAAELVRLKVDVIFASSTSAAVAAKNATRTIPIVMATGGDVVGLGLAASLARPGGNVTGLTYDVGLHTNAKGLELLKETVPNVRRVAILASPANPSYTPSIERVRVAARALGVQLQVLDVQGPNEFDSAFAAMAQERAGALLVFSGPEFAADRTRTRLLELAAKSRRPTMYAARAYPEAGGLMSYGVDLRDSFRRAATYVDKILKGAKPADLPIEQPTKFELVVNLKAAKALGLTIPQSVLLRADQVIE